MCERQKRVSYAEEMGVAYDVVTADIDEKAIRRENPEARGGRGTGDGAPFIRGSSRVKLRVSLKVEVFSQKLNAYTAWGVEFTAVESILRGG